MSDRSIGAHLFTRRAGRRRPASRPMAFDCHLPPRLFFVPPWPLLPIVKALNFLMDSLQDLDIAIVKATNHVECPPKERHFRSEC